MKQKRQSKMWQEIKLIFLTSVGLKRKKKGSSNGIETKSRRCSWTAESLHNDHQGNHQFLSLMNFQALEADDETESAKSGEDTVMMDLNHDAAKHKMAIRPSNRRTPSRLANNNNPQPMGAKIESPEEQEVIKVEEKPTQVLSRSASLSSLDFIQIQEECQNLLKTKAHSFRALPALFLVDQDLVKETRVGPNVIMMKTLPHLRFSLAEEQQEKFKISIANWCMANEGLRKSIQSLQPTASTLAPISLYLSSESLASICSGLQALDSGVADVTDVIESSSSDEEKPSIEDTIHPNVADEAEPEEVIMEEEKLDESGDCLMNVNVKERRQILMQVLNDQILNSCSSGEKFATLSRLAAKNASIVKMAVHNLDNNCLLDGDKKDSSTDHHADTDSIIAIEAASKVKLMVSKFSSKEVVA